MQVDILNPDATLFSGEAEVVTLPGIMGSFQILKNHASIISALSKGTITIDSNKEKTTFEIKGGIVEVLKNKVVVLV